MPKTPLNSANIALLDHDLIKYWLANTTSLNTRDAKRVDLRDFILAFKIKTVDDFKLVKRPDIINWRDLMLKSKTQPLSVRTIKRKMSTISKFFRHLADQQFIQVNPALDVERPKLTANEGETAIISDEQAKDLLNATDPNTLKGKRDRAILETFLFHALRRSELCQVRLKDIQEREGIKTFYIFGKGDKVRYVEINPSAIRRISEYLTALGNPANPQLPLFRSLSNNGKNSARPLTPNAVYQLVIHYAQKAGIDTGNFSTHSLRATAGTNALRNGVDIRKVQHWMGHASVQTTAMYDKRENRPEDSPSYRVKY
jgi:site-specific recombinase XerD